VRMVCPPAAVAGVIGLQRKRENRMSRVYEVIVSLFGPDVVEEEVDKLKIAGFFPPMSQRGGV